MIIGNSFSPSLCDVNVAITVWWFYLPKEENNKFHEEQSFAARAVRESLDFLFSFIGQYGVFMNRVKNSFLYYQTNARNHFRGQNVYFLGTWKQESFSPSNCHQTKHHQNVIFSWLFWGEKIFVFLAWSKKKINLATEW